VIAMLNRSTMIDFLHVNDFTIVDSLLDIPDV
jgi:hypothetical protein